MKTPPHSIDAELSVLGAILLDPESYMKVGDLLSKNDFYDPKNQLIFGAMYDLFS